MSNHSNEPFDPKPDIGLENFAESLADDAKHLLLGETGQFPAGKLDEHDEGEIKFGVAAYGEKILVNFGKPVTWFAMGPDQAESLADILLAKAKDARQRIVGVR